MSTHMKRTIYFLLLLSFPTWIIAQESSGTTGLLNIPSAEMQQDGTFRLGANYMPEHFTPAAFPYNTANYYLNLTFLPFLEITYKCILFKTPSTEKYTQQDRSFAVRLRLLKEKKYLPALVVGGNDIFSEWSDVGNQYFANAYVVASKSASWNKNKIGLSLGSGFKQFSRNGLDGFFAGLSFSPGFCRPIKLMADYDSRAFNLGASALLFKHLSLYTFVNDFENIVGGFAYKVYLKN